MKQTLPSVVTSGKMSMNRYTFLHRWVKKHKVTPQMCEACGTTETRRYEWANVSGEYRQDLDDFKRLCRACHIKYDKNLKTFCVNGHNLNENSRLRVRGHHKWRVCKECNIIYNKRWKAARAKDHPAPISKSKEAE